MGTVLSLWDAAALDKAGQDGEVAPTFVNLADASIKMVTALPICEEKLSDKFRSRPYRPETRTCNHCKMFSLSPLPAKIAISYTSIHSIRLLNGLLGSDLQCLNTRLSKSSTLDLSSQARARSLTTLRSLWREASSRLKTGLGYDSVLARLGDGVGA